MRSTFTAALAAAAVLTAGAATIRAHHAFAAEFDVNKPVKMTATLDKWEMINPHSWFHIAVKNPNGQVEEWMFEGGGPGALARRGFTKTYEGLQVGTELEIEGYLSKGVPRRANARTMKMADGRLMFVGSSGTGAPLDGADPTER